MITSEYSRQNELDPLRVDVESVIPLTNPYTFRGPMGDTNYEEIHDKFLKARSADLSMESSLVSPMFFNLSSPMLSPNSVNSDVTPAYPGCVVKIVKVGVLNRKDVTMDGGKRAIARKWKGWGAIVTNSQLLFYRDATQVLNIQRQFEKSADLPPPRFMLARPDELWSLKNVLAVSDKSYTKVLLYPTRIITGTKSLPQRDRVFRFIMADGRQSLFQAESEEDKYEWVSCINYGSSFKTADVRMRSAGMAKKDIELTGIAAAASHIRDLEMREKGSPSLRTWDGNGIPRRPRVESLNVAAFRRYSNSSETEQMSPFSDSSSIQVKNTFDLVKADLANATRSSLDLPSSFSRTHSLDLASTLSALPSSADRRPHGARSSRALTIENRIKEIESQLSETRSQLRLNLTQVQNIATLTPFQRTTRDRLHMTVLNIAKHVSRLRLEETKLVCHRDILTHDLLTADLNMQRAKETALSAAKEVLRVRSFSLTEIDVIDENTPSITRPPLPTEAIPLSRSFSGDSFHSTLDSTTDSPVTSSPLPFTPHILDSPASAQSTTTPTLIPGQTSASSFPAEYPVADSARTSSDHGTRGLYTHERFYTAPEIPEEQAEEWNKTKAAKRVSLVRVPNDLRMSLPVRTPEEVHTRLRASPTISLLAPGSVMTAL